MFSTYLQSIWKRRSVKFYKTKEKNNFKSRSHVVVLLCYLTISLTEFDYYCKILINFVFTGGLVYRLTVFKTRNFYNRYQSISNPVTSDRILISRLLIVVT